MQIIAIPTHNRVDLLLSCLECLSLVDGLDNWSLRIYDDCSSEYDIHAVVSRFGLKAVIQRNEQRLGGDINNLSMLKDCLRLQPERILLLDSDMILSPDSLEFIERHFSETDGFLGLYNSCRHMVQGDINEALVYKWSCGATATVWEAKLLAAMIQSLSDTYLWDWKASDYMNEHHIRICVARKSRAQHLGIIGGMHFFPFGKLDYGLGFEVVHEAHARALAASHQRLMVDQMPYVRAKRLPFFRRIMKRLRTRVSIALEGPSGIIRKLIR